MVRYKIKYVGNSVGVWKSLDETMLFLEFSLRGGRKKVTYGKFGESNQGRLLRRKRMGSKPDDTNK